MEYSVLIFVCIEFIIFFMIMKRINDDINIINKFSGIVIFFVFLSFILV